MRFKTNSLKLMVPQVLQPHMKLVL